MGYTALVKKQVNLAFKTVGDLAHDVTLTRKTNTAFNFSKNTATEEAETLVVKGIPSKTKKRSDERNQQTKRLLFKVEDIGDITAYDTAIINGITWKVGNIIDGNDFIIIVQLHREI